MKPLNAEAFWFMGAALVGGLAMIWYAMWIETELRRLKTVSKTNVSLALGSLIGCGFLTMAACLLIFGRLL